MEELPTDEAVLAWGDVGIPDMNKQTWNAFNVFPQSMYYRVFFQAALANEFLRQTTDDALAAHGVTARSRPPSSSTALKRDSSEPSATGTGSICSGTSRS